MRTFLLFARVSAFAAGGSAAPAAVAPHVSRDIRPMLSDNGFKCHGPDAAAREAPLRRDVRGEALAERRSGAIPIGPGKPELSEVVQRIESRFADERMPSADSKVPLAAVEITTLRRSIVEGTEDRPHWSFSTSKRTAPPGIRNRKSNLENPASRLTPCISQRARRPAHRSHRADQVLGSVTSVRTSARSVKKDFLQNSVIAAA
jgi:hypothetical protein